MRSEPVVQPAQDAVRERNQRQEGDQHGPNIDGKLQTVSGAPRDGAQKIFVLVHHFLGHLHAACRHRLLSLRYQHLGHQQRAWRSHNHGGEEVLGIDAEGDVGAHDAARDVRHPAGHDGHQLRTRYLRQKRANRQRRLGLAHEDTGGDVQRFGPARAHHPLHHPRRPLDDHLHDPEVIENGEESGDEDDRGENLEGKDETERRTLLAYLAEDKLRADVGKTQQLVHHVAGRLKQPSAVVELQHEEREGNLQAQPPGDRFQPDHPTVGGKRVRQTHHGQQAQNAGQTPHALPLKNSLLPLAPLFTDDAMHQRS